MKNWNPYLIRLELGELYYVQFNHRNKIKCKFIKTTRCGYNFLNIKTNKCILNQHLYPSKKVDPINEMFFISKKINIIKIE